MADAPQSIAQRIAALKLNQVGVQTPPSYEHATNGSAPVPTSRPRPPPPPTPARPNVRPERPALPVRTQSSNLPPLEDHAPVTSNAAGNNLPEAARPNGQPGVPPRPNLPPRTSTPIAQSPALPPRRPSESPALPPRRPSETPSSYSRRPSEYSLARRGSNESTTSVATARSNVSTTSERIKAPAYDPASLPPLPPKKTQADKEAEYDKYNNRNTAYKQKLNPTKSSPSVPQLPSRPDARKPSLPSRPQGLLQAEQNGTSPSSTPPPGRKAIVPPPAKKSALAMGFGNPATPVEDPSPASATDGAQMNGNHTPPPVPTTSKPDLAALKASKPKLDGIHTLPNSTSFASCLLCRDYSAPDNHAAQFPRETLPSQDLTQLAQNLTAPFPSATDKARAIFTWLHHNVAYDVTAFFNNCVKPSTPQSTLQSGLAVCEGYAGLFTALAVKAGLESYVITGHGKGYGYAELPAGSPVPPFNGNHAWNAVKIDGGHWKLIDSCWGAGAVGNPGEPYKKRFAPERFTQSNDDFGRDHFPSASAQQLRNDGRTLAWEEYILGNKDGCGAFFFDGYVVSEGLDRTTFKPEAGKIDLAIAGARTGGSVRFSFQKICPHWDPVRCGKGPYYVYILHLEGLEGNDAGKQKNNIPFETNGDVWWCDVPVRDLGSAGQKARIMAVTSMDGRDGRGVSVEKYKGMKGRVGMGYGFVCQWEVA